jgi:hypothetical protein
MKTRNIIIGGVIGVAAIYYARIANAAKNLQFGVGSVTKFSLKGGGISWLQGVKIINGDFVAIPIRSVSVDRLYSKTLL